MRHLAAGLLAFLIASGNTPSWQVGLRRTGPIAYGMTLADASRALGERLQTEDGEEGGCTYVVPKTAPKGLSFMDIDGRLERADVQEGEVPTISGVHIGSTEEEVKNLYPGRIEVKEHPYTGPGGHYLVYVPRDAADSAYRIVFETDGHKVERYRAGRRPAVDYIEGCS